MAHKKVCLTCKNKGCVNFCRFQKQPETKPPEIKKAG
jgi:hypothetical protein